MRWLVIAMALVVSLGVVAAEFETDFAQQTKDKIRGVINAAGKWCMKVTAVKELKIDLNVSDHGYVAACGNGERHLLIRKDRDSNKYEYIAACSDSNQC